MYALYMTLLLYTASINSHRWGVYSLWFQSSWKNLSSETWMGVAWRNLHGKEKVMVSEHCSSLGNGKFIKHNTDFPFFLFWAHISDYHHVKRQIESELVDSIPGQFSKSFLDLPKAAQQLKLKERLRKYCQKVISCWISVLFWLIYEVC